MIDPLSHEGREIRQLLDGLIADKLNALTKPTKDHDETQFLRGQIKGFKTVTDKLFPQDKDE